MPDTSIVNSLTVLLRGFADCFTSPSTSSFATLMTGWALDLRRHTITEVVRAVGAIEEQATSSLYRFFSRGRWVTDEVGMVLTSLVIERLRFFLLRSHFGLDGFRDTGSTASEDTLSNHALQAVFAARATFRELDRRRE